MTSFHVGFTGTQVGMTVKQKVSVYSILAAFKVTEEARNGKLIFHHGDCVGADAEAAKIAKELGYRIVCHPPVYSAKRAWFPADEMLPVKPYLDRNKDIVNESNYLIATPKENTEQLRSGTWSTFRYAQKKKLARELVLP